jgi:hypothetical protein
MSKFDNLKGVMDEKKKCYDDWDGLTLLGKEEKQKLLRQVCDIWASRANMDILVAWTERQMQISISAYNDSVNRLNSLEESINKWFEKKKRGRK